MDCASFFELRGGARDCNQSFVLHRVLRTCSSDTPDQSALRTHCLACECAGTGAGDAAEGAHAPLGVALKALALPRAGGAPEPAICFFGIIDFLQVRRRPQAEVPTVAGVVSLPVCVWRQHLVWLFGIEYVSNSPLIINWPLQRQRPGCWPMCYPYLVGVCRYIKPA